jgi:hypothetical protein
MKTRTAALNRRTAGGIDLASLIVIGVVVVAVAVTGFSIYRGGALKSELVRARGDADRERAELQSQIKTASAKIREAAEQTTQMQAQVDVAKTEAATAKANAASQVNQLQLQLDQSKRQTVEANSKVQRLSTELASLRTQLQESSVSPSPAPAPAPAKVQPAPAPAAAVNPEPANLARLPLNVSFKKAPLGDSNALALQNTSNSSLALAVKFSNPSESKEVQVKLDPGASREIGWLGAWVLAPGDKVEIKSAGYAAIVRTAP